MLFSLNDASTLRLVQIALAEDIGTGDATAESIFDDNDYAVAEIIVKAEGIICGLPIAELVFRKVSRRIDFQSLVTDGTEVVAGTAVACLSGVAADILAGERTALNFLQRMSGVATLTRRYADAVAGTGTTVLDTRKTIPGWRLLDKYAVKTGGGSNHRFGLFDMAMIKDNHIAAAGGIAPALEKCKNHLSGRNISIEIETDGLDQIREALACGGFQRIMFDNFTPQETAEAVRLVGGRCETESSGGITLDNIRHYAETGVNFISVGALTHSATALDISLDMRLQPRAQSPLTHIGPLYSTESEIAPSWEIERKPRRK
ncbi:carboxylating nicotinate-nucleotide diphosphorylase [Ignavibacteria bacterium]|nr:carboxylating nicotinate-nucleotide diphosphorylase [Bacteroidota bacterium]MCZ2132914.1 carboxylating nicotinate-nucleotide diphosphorylase [Bacteroidota bacterium]